MSGHNETPVYEFEVDPSWLDENGDVDLDLMIENLGPTDAGNPWFNVNNVPITPETEPDCIETGRCVAEQVFIEQQDAQPAQIEGFVSITNTETVREYEAFGIKLNDSDDFITVGILLAVVLTAYVGKCYIDYIFAIALERWKEKRGR